MSNTKGPAVPSSPVVADLGSRRRKDIRKLRRGEGPLLEDAQKLVAQLQADKAITEGAQAVILVVKERRRRAMIC